MTDVDAVIAGGGVAGSATAAALATLGWSVLIVEPGQHDDRRLAGELIHPAGVASLAALDLLSGPTFAAAARLDGFAIFPAARLAGCIELPYQETGEGPAFALAQDHAGICRGLLATVCALPNVTVARGWRVTGLADRNGAGVAPIVVVRNAGVTETVRCRLVVAADGASSPVRSYAGLPHERTRNAALTGCVVESEALPIPGRAHVFTASGGPVLAYAIGSGRARVLFNRRLPAGTPARFDDPAAIEALPPGLRSRVRLALAGGAARHFVSGDVVVGGVTRGRVVLVGDAAGTCHPISASGMTMGIDDAVRLASALRRRDGDSAAALSLDAAERRSRQRARVLLAGMLHEVLGSQGTEMAMPRAGLLRYWTGSARAREASMALLGMTDVRMRSILLEFARVMASGFVASLSQPLGPRRRAGMMAALSRPMLRHMVGVLRVQ